jgi:hypothetical protein
MMNTDEKLCVKQLADALQVSPRYVHEMRRCGFVMTGVKRCNQTSTAQKAVAWIEANDFRIINGLGFIRPPRDESAPRKTGLATIGDARKV